MSSLAHIVTEVTTHADAVMTSLLAGGITPDQGNRLACLVSQMRVGVQVDAGVVEGFTRVACVAVWRLAEAGVPVDVGILAPGGSTAHVSDEVIELLVRAGSVEAPGRRRIQSLSTDGWDFLSLAVPSAGADLIGMGPGESREISGITVSVSAMDEVGPHGVDMVVITLEKSLD